MKKKKTNTSAKKIAGGIKTNIEKIRGLKKRVHERPPSAEKHKGAEKIQC